MTVTLATVVTGLIAGLGIGGLAAGLVLVYRASKVVNLAQAELGAAAAAGCAWLVSRGHLPVGVAVMIAVAAAAATGALIQLAVVRRIASGSAAAVVIATAGVSEILLGVSLVVITRIGRRGGYPVLFQATVDLGDGVVLHGADLALLVAIPALSVALAVILRFTRVGAAVRASADNPDAARVAGIPVAAVSAWAWAAAAALSAIVVICLLAGRPIVGTEALGPEVLFESLAAAVVARFRHLPRAVAAGIGLGVIQQVAAYNWPGSHEVVLFVVVAAAALVVGRRSAGGCRVATEWLLLPVVALRPGPRRWVWWIGPVVLAAVALAVATTASNSQALTFTEIAAYAILAISATLVVGVAGQLSLGQVGFFGVGAAVSYQLSASVGLPFWLSFLAAGVCAGATSAAVGIPALRAQGPMFAVISLGFALLSAGWLLSRPWLLGAGAYIPRPILGPIDLAAQRTYFLFAVFVLCVAACLARSFVRRRPGRQIVAVRDNEAAAASFGVVPGPTKLAAFAVAGFLAGIAGAVYGHGLQSVSVNDFPVAAPGLQIGAIDSFRIVAIAVIGGLGSIWGAVVAAALIIGIDEITTSASLRLASTGAGLLVVLLVFPGGLAGLFDSLATRLGRGRAAFPGRGQATRHDGGGPPLPLAPAGDQ